LLYPRLFLAVYAAAGLVWILYSRGLIDPAGHPLGADFMTPWSASRLAQDRAPAAAYDIMRMWAAERAAVGNPGVGYAGFYYPPIYLLIVFPLAFLPYAWSLIAWSIATLSAYLATVWKIVPEWPALWLALAFPGVLVNLTNGQNGFLTTALLAGALLSVERAPVLAGALFGLMSYKPQFATLAPLFLLVTGRWRALVAAAGTVGLLAAASFAAFGADTWRAFFGSLDFSRRVVLEHGGIGFRNMQSLFAFARLWGLDVTTAYALQACASAAAVVGAVYVWRRTAKPELHAAALALGTLLFSPYLVDYDLVILALPIAWLGVQGRRLGFLPFEKSLLVLAWILPAVARTFAGRAGIPLTPVVLLLLLGIVIRRSALPHGDSAHTDASTSLATA
ncbi:MAG TPA: glycosyltransferase family 87 protein, partial [Candidatus Acidoferrales bacterium]|nr:glycosyltransferase family 87 protein [Candidatus Acidoferrales bacterium]